MLQQLVIKKFSIDIKCLKWPEVNRFVLNVLISKCVKSPKLRVESTFQTSTGVINSVRRVTSFLFPAVQLQLISFWSSPPPLLQTSFILIWHLGFNPLSSHLSFARLLTSVPLVSLRVMMSWLLSSSRRWFSPVKLLGVTVQPLLSASQRLLSQLVL